MESTAINTVYCIMHCVGDSEWEVKNNEETHYGFLWDIYTREDTAKAECKFLNELEKKRTKVFDSKDSFIVVEKRLW